ncbi:acetyl-CoA carboxylase biotin carboxyl carrier protein subunit [Bacteroidia bacterium]|nr:acetyl-CoA carboxylase biotin carboxyl carrier protein subunit [Bacteroidia bacterium]
MKEYKLKINGNSYRVAVKSIEGNIAKVEVNGTLYKVEMEQELNVPANKTPKIVQQAPVVAAAAQPVKTSAPTSVGAVKSPLPGVILSVAVKEGDVVKEGQKLLVLEAMKMENNIEADHAGTVTAIKVQQGDSVLEGTDLVIIS